MLSFLLFCGSRSGNKLLRLPVIGPKIQTFQNHSEPWFGLIQIKNTYFGQTKVRLFSLTCGPGEDSHLDFWSGSHCKSLKSLDQMRYQSWFVHAVLSNRWAVILLFFFFFFFFFSVYWFITVTEKLSLWPVWPCLEGFVRLTKCSVKCNQTKWKCNIAAILLPNWTKFHRQSCVKMTTLNYLSVVSCSGSVPILELWI